MGRSIEQRYGDTAVIFHWLIALLIIGLLAIGKYMSSLDENDPVRYALTQWHKSFGITVLLLSLLRLAWRFTHKPPPELDSIPNWQQRAASLAHGLLYVLMIAIPLTGWIMVSASPLNLDTVLFNVIEWPHLPPFASLENRESIAHSFHDYHEIAANLLILILLAHIGAALKHHWLDKDGTLLRMLPEPGSTSFRCKSALLAATLVTAGGALYISANADNQAALLAAGDSEVSFLADVAGEQTPGVFSDTTVEALIDADNPSASTIVARVRTASVSSDNLQVAGSLPEPEWFAAETHPEALFESTSIASADDGSLLVSGYLTIKETTQEISFPMSLSTEEDRQVARGEFTIDRREFDIGMESQQSDDFVGYPVLIRFRFDIAEADA
ncbi:cytochrome b/b6 domain-containing protein [Granulosicoccus sp. 3-233]|uniref:cytochrome b/b6 domain-containing protein n=1 Tax=Granulosicoccus sp. 3-233 TaxID=3417969 RepID=UPI003D3303F8